ncbi:SCO3242 family prenyltransferase, partial [Streptomyces sp. NPDC004561]
ATPLAATVWAYDLVLKRTPAGPVAMAAARGLDLLLGAAATRPAPGTVRRALPSAALLGAHTLALTTVSRHETTGGDALPPLAALATTGTLGLLLSRELPSGRGAAPAPGPTGGTAVRHRGSRARRPVRPPLGTVLSAAYTALAARAYLHAALNPSPPLTQRAVGGGIRATIPLQAALCARAGASVTALCTAALAPLAARFSRKVSVT